MNSPWSSFQEKESGKGHHKVRFWSVFLWKVGPILVRFSTFWVREVNWRHCSTCLEYLWQESGCLHSWHTHPKFKWPDKLTNQYFNIRTFIRFYFQVFPNSNSRSLPMANSKVIGSRNYSREPRLPFPSHSPSQHGDDPWLRFMWWQNHQVNLTS